MPDIRINGIVYEGIDKIVTKEASGGEDVVFGNVEPSGKLEITDTQEKNVTEYAYAQVVDDNLAPENIKKNVTILGIVGTHETPTQSKTLTLGANAPQTVNPDSGKALSSVPVVLDTSVIKAENIKKNVQMLGIVGTHEGGTTPTLIEKTITQNGTYNASSDNADGYNQVTVAIPTYDGTVV